MIFETERLVVRHFQLDDFDLLYEMYSDPDMRQYFPEGVLDQTQTKEELDWFLLGDPTNKLIGLWAIIQKSDGEFVGRGGLLEWDIEGVREIEIAYMIRKRYWRQGLGSEIARGLVFHGFQETGADRLIALVDSSHTASIKTAESAGLAYWKSISMDGIKSDVLKIDRK